MNYKPGSVEITLSGGFIAAICLKEPFPSLFSSLPAFNRRAAGVTLRLPRILDFAPDEACHSVDVAIAEVGSYPAFSPLPDH